MCIFLKQSFNFFQFWAGFIVIDTGLKKKFEKLAISIINNIHFNIGLNKKGMIHL